MIDACFYAADMHSKDICSQSGSNRKVVSLVTISLSILTSIDIFPRQRGHLSNSLFFSFVCQ